MRQRWVRARAFRRRTGEQAPPSGERRVVNPGPAPRGHYAVADIDEAVTVRRDP